ncbi:nuclear transport factor 2 family protein [Methylobacterium aquaticum]|uniref:nuclear transport factor 2 family protein n=1 Tax=Methylobacterium aquaticum TaxID=270351 RepID=UPI00193191F8|nr:nuclear transport factor 2 family protein [Methylobacterium aquaticum]QRE74493.1 nuclear transport factor 2 family protein [Methylobacterium aquaticum]
MERTETCSRRVLLAGMTMGAMAAPILGSGAARAADGTEAVAQKLEALRVAIVDGDAKALDALTHPQLSYGHSSGRKIETRPQFIASLAGKTNYKSLTFSEPWFQIVGDTATVRHVWDGADILPNGETGRSYIAVMQVWLKDGDWRLLARQSCPLKPA